MIWLMIAVALPALTGAQPPADGTDLTATELQGLRLFRQRCFVCHAPSITVNSSATYGPRLSKRSIEGREKEARTIIAEGSPRMPGFVYSLQPSEIDAIVAYLKTVEKPVDIERLEERK
jgi:mono/diheme cytochrome c family protein